MDTRIVKFEVSVRLEGDGCVLGMPDAVCEGIKEAIQRSESESALYTAIGVSASFESVMLIDPQPGHHPAEPTICPSCDKPMKADDHDGVFSCFDCDYSSCEHCGHNGPSEG